MQTWQIQPERLEAGILELALLVAICVIMGKVASASNCHPWAWGGITLVVAIACLFLLDWPFLRLMLAAILSFVALTLYRMKAGIV